jgi:ankyrin repeat protein
MPADGHVALQLCSMGFFRTDLIVMVVLYRITKRMTDAVDHPADEASFSSVAALWHMLAPDDDDGDDNQRIPPPPLAPLLLHALIKPDAALVFAAARGSPIFPKIWRQSKGYVDRTVTEALSAAVVNKQLATFEVLLRRPIDVNGPPADNTPTLLQRAATAGSTEMVRQLLLCFASIEETTQYQRDTPLTLAVREGHRGCAELLLQAGAVPSRAALQAAIERHDEQLLLLVLSFGAGVDLSILQFAARHNMWDWLPMMATLAARTGATALIRAVIEKDAFLVQALLKTMSDAELHVNHSLPNNSALYPNHSALSLAVHWGNLPVVLALLERGAIPGAKSRAAATQTDTHVARAIRRLFAGSPVQEFPAMYPLTTVWEAQVGPGG